ncbi:MULTISPECIES: tRNA preQ1(34) S-adenosylmethionine ribosyltransferase-isomerase QueA [unclassified Fibrobacter]|uniref:tRNA preQ1(34) S-adenosylmethionine ribosyltransferase-isomerase QueA n=1 Tax=unclassified Fibrobacter TaxID=2634177 RepID=UPI000910BBAC|nr:MULTISPECIES: tRNA preQ1(34) S-adenosylmethionine ribosyltransferase-isomerase QueA [Fibrobacter]MDO4946974.1 tRNA preQ1(34) S-adenosylmethionine ribosyltransferase-isomerase QueA [Fibrobacter sp.]MCL4101411.1 S-adenosylmethionine:tRNA ribosyltransferase-isomerase [Fibrobacter succinogenes]OWV07586.1 tRNA preQ1(34) S-adenosylmethionine ribosyltransferase-isomerase QueA [Fibrobacter sp. UWH3]OWV17489.1 tRNA preQ1(34) S-adenosylmethionine ribosyltransferase-isomerase QueA [Fibrobacter sp. UWH1
MEHNLSDYSFEFPPELIASRTAGKGKTRILHCPKDGGERHIMKAADIVDLFRAGDCLVVNNTKVIPARLYGKTMHDGEVETLLVQAMIPAEDGSARYEAQVRPGKAFKVGRELIIAGVKTTVESINEDGSRVLRFAVTPVELEAVMNAQGHVPLPPYINRPDDEEDKKAYQTIFAKYSGAVAAPTASLHFSEEMLQALKDKGVKVAEVTLHVGPGTFQNISVEDFTQHKMHGEHYELTEENARIINEAKAAGGRVVTVGTTSTRVVETIADDNGVVRAQSGVTHAFFYPGYRYKIVDGLLTNFHWPKSSLILLVSAFYGRENTLAAYKMAVENRLKLFSYGDGMLIL